MGKLRAFLAGIVLGVLFAPRTGRESRRTIEAWLSEFFKLGDDRLDEVETEIEARKAFSEEELP